MNLSLNWLNEFVKTDMPIRDFCEAMTMSGSKVEGFSTLGEDVINVMTGKIVDITRHPGADKLQICKLDFGDGEPLQIITAATNVSVGDIVPVARDGARLPGGTKIKAGKLRGEDSFGMLCGVEEIGLTTHDMPGSVDDGILILDKGTPIGRDITEVLELKDTVVEFEITPNRPDCLSVIGLAREAGATFNSPVSFDIPSASEKCGIDGLSVTVENPELCPRYSAKIVTDVKIAPSPMWLRRRLRSSGIRPINNIVDITNYVMLEYGQPMHAFDFSCIDGGSIAVRCALDNEKFITLDNQERLLSAKTLVIADKNKPVAIAGLMGGANSEITEATKTIVFESANFNHVSVRNTSRALGMRTDSSARFEKGLDAQNTLPALLRACQLVELLGAGRVCDGLIDVKASEFTPTRIKFEPERINALLGTDISAEAMKKYLTALEFVFDGEEIIVPSFRADVEVCADIAEEVARMYGYNKIPDATAHISSPHALLTNKQIFERALSETARALGYSECVTYSFINPKHYELIRAKNTESVKILNPLGDETSVMRTTMLVSIMEVLSRNFNLRNASAKLFELGTVYIPSADVNELPDEIPTLVLGSYGESMSFFTLKGALEVMFDTLNIPSVTYEPVRDNPTWHPGRCAKVFADGVEIGIMGEIHPLVSDAFDVSVPLYAAELDMRKMLAALVPTPEYKPLPKFPAVNRDLAIVCDAQTPVGHLERCIESAVGKTLESVSLFDVYTGHQVQDGKKSVAFSLTLRAADRTLNDDEADKCVSRALKALEKDFQAYLRS